MGRCVITFFWKIVDDAKCGGHSRLRCRIITWKVEVVFIIIVQAPDVFE